MMVREDNEVYLNPSIVMNRGTELYCAPVRVSTLRKLKARSNPTVGAIK